MGLQSSAQYYAYDGPIYVGHHAEPPDKVIADVQAVLQDMGYYTGEVDGLLGPLTREALTGYQRITASPRRRRSMADARFARHGIIRN